MADPLATTDQLAERLPFVMSPEELREAEGALIDLSDDARRLGNRNWLDAASAPEQVVNLVLRAAKRHMKNYEGYVQSRAGDETVVFSDRGESMGDASFTDGEARILRELVRGPSGFTTVAMGFDFPVRQALTVGFVPAQGGGDPFPMFADGVEPW